MRATFLLIRHAAYAEAGRSLAGRTPGFALSDEGRRQAAALVGRVGEVAAVYASPVQRARETAAPLARARGLDVRVAPEVVDIEFGAWTGRTFASLEGDPTWAAYNARRGEVAIPGGEHFLEVAGRVNRGLTRLAAEHAGERLVVVSHADVIRVALSLALGMNLNQLLRLEIDLASMSEITWGGGEPRVRLLGS